MNVISPDPVMMAKRAVAVIESSRIDVSTEAKAHDAIARALIQDGFEVQREVQLSAEDRVDILVGDVAIEVKVRGNRRRNIHSQLGRYAKHDQVRAMVLASAAAWPSKLAKVGGKPLLFANLSRGWL